ncbi:MAG: LysM domain-containing protein [Clostridiales bacterium]|jgi:LysM repeat protein|nr:LysM domain-containing protein [Clostridiales bacterium]
MDQVNLPDNIKQIGSICDGIRIYMEDYVYSYLCQYAEAGGYQERVALLAGRFQILDGQQILFISGAIQGKYTEIRNGLTLFTEESLAFGQDCVNRYFSGMKIVGWMQSQPSYGSYINAASKEAHRDLFPKKYQALFVMDPLEKTNTFYVYSQNGLNLEETKGYFIYYDKNESMRTYAADNDAAEEPEPSVLPAVAPSAEEKSDPPYLLQTPSLHQTVQKDVQDQKRVVNLLVALSAVMFIVSFIMGAGLIQNQDQIHTLRQQVVELSTSYRDLLATSVFAPENVTTPVNQTAEDPSSPPPAVIDINGNQVLEEQKGTEASASEASASETIVPAAAATEAIASAETAAATETSVSETNVSETNVSETAAPTDKPEPPAPETPAPTKAPAKTPATLPSRYTVKEGDSLNSISIRFYGSIKMVQKIMDLNEIRDQDMIVSGKTLQLPPK